MNLRKTIAKQFVQALVKTPEGRAHLLNQIAEGEERGEVRFFDLAIDYVEDPRFKKMIDKHRSDEVRHGEMFRACLDRNGVPVSKVPPHLDMLANLDEALGGVFDNDVTSDEDVMRAFAILQVIEERALDQFGMYAEVFGARGDHETAETFQKVEKDEGVHLKYCRAIGVFHAPSPEAYEAAVAEYREVEARTFRDTQRANVDHILEHGLAPNLWAKLFFTVLQKLTPRIDDLPYTQFKTAAVGAA